jgi:hypothetical protein
MVISNPGVEDTAPLVVSCTPPAAFALLETCNIMPPTLKLDTFIVSLKCRTSVSAAMSRSRLTSVAAVTSRVSSAACFVAAVIRLRALLLMGLPVNCRNVVFAETARSVAAVTLLTSAGIMRSVTA